MGMRISAGRCCCCELAADDFDRSDSDAPGGFWDERVGDWDIASNKMSTTSSNGLLLFEPSPQLPTNVHILVTVDCPADCDVVRLYCDILDPDDVDAGGIPNNCHWAEFRWSVSVGAVCTRRIRTYRRTAGVDTLLLETTGIGGMLADQDTFGLGTGAAFLALCLQGPTFSAWCGSAPESTGAYTTPHGGRYIALGTGAISGAAVTFNDLEVFVPRTFGSCSICAWPCINVLENVIAKEYKVVVAGVTDGWEGLGIGPNYNGTWFVPTLCHPTGYNPLNVRPCCSARLQIDVCVPGGCAGPEYLTVSFGDLVFGGNINCDVAGSRWAVTQSPKPTAIFTDLNLPRTAVLQDRYANTNAATVTVTALP